LWKNEKDKEKREAQPSILFVEKFYLYQQLNLWKNFIIYKKKQKIFHKLSR
jgi:hypothetical protein